MVAGDPVVTRTLKVGDGRWICGTSDGHVVFTERPDGLHGVGIDPAEWADADREDWMAVTRSELDAVARLHRGPVSRLDVLALVRACTAWCASAPKHRPPPHPAGFSVSTSSVTTAARRIARRMNITPGGYLLAFDLDGRGGTTMYALGSVINAPIVLETSHERVTERHVQRLIDDATAR